jgi:hypothetical protein
VPNEEEVQRILDRAELESSRTKQRRAESSFWFKRSTPWVAAAAGTCALAASLLLYARTESSSPGSEAASSSAAAAPVGKAQEDSCGALVEGVVVCLTAGSEVGRIDLSNKDRSLQLLSGRALVAITAPVTGSSFTVTTSAGSAVATAAVFSVEVRPDHGVWARATRGVVGVRGPGATFEQTVLAGQELRFGAAAASAISLQDAQRDAGLLSRWEKVMSDGKP